MKSNEIQKNSSGNLVGLCLLIAFLLFSLFAMIMAYLEARRWYHRGFFDWVFGSNGLFINFLYYIFPFVCIVLVILKIVLIVHKAGQREKGD